ncbi:MAG: hypothetical protein ACR2FY_11070 [Pirellulaceae bacterium]
MLKLVKIFTFAAICTLATIAGAQIGILQEVFDMQCQNWVCSGITPEGCEFNGIRVIQTCFVVPPTPPQSCMTQVDTYMICEGEDEEEDYCSHFYPKCLHPVNP